MNIGIITYNETPYRKLQFHKFSCLENISLKIYYCNNVDRTWEMAEIDNLNEVKLSKLKIGKYELPINKGLLQIVKKNDFLIIGGYDQLTYIFLSILCRIYKKRYAIMFDGISCNKLKQNKKSFKYKIKKIVIKYAKSVFGNGTVSKRYFIENFDKKSEEIFNQYLTIDGEKILINNKRKIQLRDMYRKKYNIKKTDKVIFYAGRLIEEKNIDNIIEAISIMRNRKDIILFIAGGGNKEEELRKLAEKRKVKLIITGFIQEQEKLFEHYYIADLFTLMSIDEAWGLVVNEAMYAELPIVLSKNCGSALDLVENYVNGLIVDPTNIEEISEAYEKILAADLESMGKKSLEIIKEWNFENSTKEFIKMINASTIEK